MLYVRAIIETDNIIMLVNYAKIFLQANLPPVTPGRQPGSARSSLSSVRSSASSMKSPSASARPTPVQIGADFRGTCNYVTIPLVPFSWKFFAV